MRTESGSVLHFNGFGSRRVVDQWRPYLEIIWSAQ